jgi:hypothetical protein
VLDGKLLTKRYHRFGRTAQQGSSSGKLVSVMAAVADIAGHRA